MAEGSDPVAREMAEQLRSGQVRPRDLLLVPEYRRVLERGTRRIAELVTTGEEAGRDPAQRVRNGS
jgi:hypothetical protein